MGINPQATMSQYGIVIQDMLSGQVEHSAFPGLSAPPEGPEEEFAHEEEIKGVEGLAKELAFPIFKHSAFPRLSAPPEGPEEEFAHEEEIKGVEGLAKELAFPIVILSFHLKYSHP
nr:hypothetical protein [Tanacetum cinerariifolium]